MSTFVCTRSMPIGGSWDNPRYSLMKFSIDAVNAPAATRIADDVQADAKIKRWGKKPMVKL